MLTRCGTICVSAGPLPAHLSYQAPIIRRFEMPSDPQEPQDFDTTIHLVGAAQDGDRSAMERLFTRYLPRVRQIVALRMGRRLGRFMETDDIAQEALLKAFNGLDRFEHKSEGSFRNWLARCVECEIKDQVRKVDAKKRGAGKVYRFGDCSSDILVSSIFAGSGPHRVLGYQVAL